MYLANVFPARKREGTKVVKTVARVGFAVLFERDRALKKKQRLNSSLGFKRYLQSERTRLRKEFFDMTKRPSRCVSGTRLLLFLGVVLESSDMFLGNVLEGSGSRLGMVNARVG